MRSKILKILSFVAVVTLVLGAVSSCGTRDEPTPAATPTLPTSLSLAI